MKQKNMSVNFKAGQRNFIRAAKRKKKNGKRNDRLKDNIKQTNTGITVVSDGGERDGLNT